MEQNTEIRDRYFQELFIQLKGKGFATLPLEDGHLPVERGGERICAISGNGWVKYDPGGGDRLDEPRCEVVGVTRSVSEYMELMEGAPDLEMSDLNKGYKRLAYTCRTGDYLCLDNDDDERDNLIFEIETARCYFN